MSTPVRRYTIGDVTGSSDVSRVTESSTISPSEPRMTIRRARNGFHHWFSTKSYRPMRPPPKSSVAIVVVLGPGFGSLTHPLKLNGSTSGAVNVLALTTTASMSTPRKARTSETAWYRWVEAISTDVTVPMAPACVTASREACPGMRVYCSPTWTRPEAPTSCHSDRKPSSSGAGGVSARTLAPAATSSRTIPGMAGQDTAEMTNSGLKAWRTSCCTASA